MFKTTPYIAPGLNAIERQRMRDAITLRQAAEWGNRGYQSSFSRLYDVIPYDEHGERLLF